MSETNRWEPFTDDEVRALLVELVTDDGVVYGIEDGDEPRFTLWRELTAEIERRGIELWRHRV